MPVHDRESGNPAPLPNRVVGSGKRACALLALLLTLGLLLSTSWGCGPGQTTEDDARVAEVRQAIQYLSDMSSFPFQIRLETWVSVTGYTAYGEETGSGEVAGDDFTVELTRWSPEGEGRYTLSSREGELAWQEGETSREIGERELPSPLFRPRRFLVLFAKYSRVEGQSREERDGIACRVYDLEYDPGLVAEALSIPGMEYFSNLDFQLRGRLWVVEGSSRPVAMNLEVTGLDRIEKLQRLRLSFTFLPRE
ncbi:MAG: hypothetical protein ACUVRX_08190 [Actinomycetota bacterium]